MSNNLNHKKFHVIILLCILPLVLSACTQSNNPNWDKDIRFIDVTNNETVKDKDTISTALSCIELLKNTSDNPFECKIQDVQYAKSVQVENNDYFLIAFALGDKAPTSCLVMYDRSNEKTCIYGFDELIYNREIIAQLNSMYLKIIQLNAQGIYTGTMLNQGHLSTKEIASRISDFYHIWRGE